MTQGDQGLHLVLFERQVLFQSPILFMHVGCRSTHASVQLLVAYGAHQAQVTSILRSLCFQIRIRIVHPLWDQLLLVICLVLNVLFPVSILASSARQ